MADARRLHAGEVTADLPLVRALVAAQFPAWAHLAVSPVSAVGTDHTLFRIGDGLVARLPRLSGAAAQAVKERRWLGRLGPHLPLRIPVLAGAGEPALGYPWPWSVYGWIEGAPLGSRRLADAAAARDLGRCLTALRRLDPAGGPTPEADGSLRGAPLALRDGETRLAIAALGERVDSAGALAVWEKALQAPGYRGDGVWVHGDLTPMNVLAREGRLAAVIDFGCLGVGDPAVDLMAAWTLLGPEGRAAFRASLMADEAAWARGRGWALSWALIALPYYQGRHAAMAAAARRTIAQVLGDGAVHRTAGETLRPGR